MENKKTTRDVLGTLDQQKYKLLNMYSTEELEHFSLLIQQSNQCLYGDVIKCNIYTREDGSNG